MNCQDAIAKAIPFLASSGVESPRLESELIIAEALGIDRLKLYLGLSEPFPDEAREKARAMLDRRRKREPLAYILGRREFYSVSFEVSPAVLIPRPETEHLVDAVLVWSKSNAMISDSNDPPLLVDIGTGSGAIAVAAAFEQKKRGQSVRWIATDISKDALAIARSNAVRHGVEERIEFRLGEFFEPIRDEEKGRIACIVANPPYIAEFERPTLQPEVADWEPAAALFSGDDGLRHIATLVRDTPNYLAPGGSLFFEFGDGQWPRIEAALKANSAWAGFSVHKDLSGKPRIAEAFLG